MVAGHKDLQVFLSSEVKYFAEYILTILARFILNIPLVPNIPVELRLPRFLRLDNPYRILRKRWFIAWVP